MPLTHFSLKDYFAKVQNIRTDIRNDIGNAMKTKYYIDHVTHESLHHTRMRFNRQDVSRPYEHVGVTMVIL